MLFDDVQNIIYRYIYQPPVMDIRFCSPFNKIKFSISYWEILNLLIRLIWWVIQFAFNSFIFIYYFPQKKINGKQKKRNCIERNFMSKKSRCTYISFLIGKIVVGIVKRGEREFFFKKANHWSIERRWRLVPWLRPEPRRRSVGDP